MRTRLPKLLLLVGACVLVAFLTGADKIMWVGQTDLTVTFVVTDAETGQPLNGAEIVILSESELQADDRSRENGDRKKEFLLKTGTNGTAEHVCRGSVCSGARSALGLVNTFAVRTPAWNVTVSAPGRTAAEPFDLQHSERKVERTGPGQSKIVVPVALSRAAK